MDNDIVKKIYEFNFRNRKITEDKQTLLPTLPNLYGLEVRFKKTEEEIEREDEKQNFKQALQRQKDNNQNNDMEKQPINRHGRIVPKGAYLSPISYKIKKRNLAGIEMYNT